MTQKIKVLISKTYNPWFNLATEDWIFKNADPEYAILFLWRNQDTVVIGRFQNPWRECQLEKMEEDHILLARRQSGGGAVFQDLGNTNFTFMSSKENFSKDVNNKIICNALNKFENIEVIPNGRNDLVAKVGDDLFKVSGSAFKEKKDRSFHHGTLLLNANMKKLGDYLTPSKKKLESKGIKSVRSRVVNLKELNDNIEHEVVSSCIIEEFFEHYGQKCEVEFLDDAYLKSIPELSDYYESLKDWKWRFGETPKFNHHLEERFEWGGIDLHINSNKGMIDNVVIFSDSLHPEMIKVLMDKMIAVSYSKEGIQEAISNAKQELPMIEDYLMDFESWLIKNI